MKKVRILYFYNAFAPGLEQEVEQEIARKEKTLSLRIGSLLRRESNSKSELWNYLENKYLNQGLRIPSEEINSIINNWLEENTNVSEVVLLDYPRTNEELHGIEAKVITPGHYLFVSDQKVEEVIRHEWNENEYSYLRKYNPTLSDLKAHIERWVVLKNEREKHLSEVDFLQRIDISEYSKKERGALIKELLSGCP